MSEEAEPHWTRRSVPISKAIAYGAAVIGTLAFAVACAGAVMGAPAINVMGFTLAAGFTLGAFPWLLQNAAILDLNEDLIREVREVQRINDDLTRRLDEEPT